MRGKKTDRAASACARACVIVAVALIGVPGAARASDTVAGDAPPLYVAQEDMSAAAMQEIIDASRGADARRDSADATSGEDAAQGAPPPPLLIVRRPPGRRIAPLMATAGLPASTDFGRALDCMTMAIAYEAGNEPIAGREAVGQVILNRMRAARFPKTVCGVVFEGSTRPTGCQFTFTCDGSLRRRLQDTTMQGARLAAGSVLAGAAPDRVAGATHYHASYVLPYWASSGARVARIGAHIFYRMPGDAFAPAGAVAIANEPAIAELQADAANRRDIARAPVQMAAATPGRAMFTPWGLMAPAQR